MRLMSAAAAATENYFIFYSTDKAVLEPQVNENENPKKADIKMSNFRTQERRKNGLCQS